MASMHRTSTPPLFLYSAMIMAPSVVLLLAFLVTIPAASSDPIFQRCSTASNFTANSTFGSNLNALLSNISTTAADGYANATVGAVPDQVYGVANCRGDVDQDKCNNCLSIAVTDVRQLCPFSRSGIVGYDYCLLRYSNQIFIGSVDTGSVLYLGNPANVSTSDAPRFKKRLSELMAAMSSWAEFNSSGKLFATGEVNFTAADPKIFGLVQCTRDLSPENCGQCLQLIVRQISSCCEQSRGGQVIAASCALRFELSSFYDGLPDVVVPASLESDEAVLAPAPAPAPAPASPSPPTTNTDAGNSMSTGKIVAIVIPVAIISLLVSGFCVCFFKKRKSRSESPIKDYRKVEIASSGPLLFDLSTLRTATNNFAEANVLGRGGYGPVYKGLLANGSEVAVKRLSTNSDQGLGEFKAELALIAKLQHKNLVKLVGFCLENQEKLLVYEYVANRSLDTIIFDDARCEELDWRRRYNIIQGIARGLQYLHEDSQLKIIHRDLKAGNILLDLEMNPKISDFGMARLFGVDQTQAMTSRVVGTFGYMAPEYVQHGQFSSKSDAYSFGILVLEIIAGRKIRSFLESGQHTLLSYIWEHWADRTILDIVDASLRGRYSRTEVLRCVQIGLLCVQDDPAQRPSMFSVGLMLSSFSMTVGVPTRPRSLLSGYSSEQ